MIKTIENVVLEHPDGREVVVVITEISGKTKTILFVVADDEAVIEHDNMAEAMQSFYAVVGEHCLDEWRVV